MLSQGFAGDTDAAGVESTTNSGPEDNSSQPSGWQPSSDTLASCNCCTHKMLFACNKTTPFSESCRHVDVQQASNMQTCAEIVFTNVCSRASGDVQVDLLMLRRKRLLCPQQWMAKSSSHQLVQSQSHQKAASSLRPGPQGSLERIYTFWRSPNANLEQPWSLNQGSLDTAAYSIGTIHECLHTCQCVRCFTTILLV